MAVIINELEVVVESHAEASAASSQPQPVPPAPAELDDLDSRRIRGLLRVEAH